MVVCLPIQSLLQTLVGQHHQPSGSLLAGVRDITSTPHQMCATASHSLHTRWTHLLLLSVREVMEGEGRPEPKVVTVCRSKGLDEVALQGWSREGGEGEGRVDCGQREGHKTCLVLSSHELSGPCYQLGERQARKGGTRWEEEDLARQRVKGLPNARQCGRTHCVRQEESIVPTEICTSPPAVRE